MTTIIVSFILSTFHVIINTSTIPGDSFKVVDIDTLTIPGDIVDINGKKLIISLT